MPNPNEQDNTNTNDNDTANTNTDATNQVQNANDNSDANDDHAQQQPQYATMQDVVNMQTAINNLTQTLGEIMGGIKAIKDAQGVMVKAGTTIVDDTEPEPLDDFKPLSELDFSIKK